MKLNDLLQKHLTQWPEGVMVIVQDPNGDVRGMVKRESYSGQWFWAVGMVQHNVELADDYESAFVTEADWLQA